VTATPSDEARSTNPDNNARPDDATTTTPALGRREVVAREKEQFGGMKFGSAFFGWLAATGTAVILTAILAAAGTALGLARSTTVTESDARTVSLVGAIVVLAVIFVAYYCGGYVAGRMARFNGIKQGVAVWLWAIIMAIVIAVLGALAGPRFDILARLNGFPRIPLNEGALTTTGVLTALGVALTSLLGAVLGGLTGMRFHRRVDRAGLGR
jgi:hypothetical protein